MHKTTLPHINACVCGERHAHRLKKHQVSRSTFLFRHLYPPGVQLCDRSGCRKGSLALINVGNQTAAVKPRGQGVSPVSIRHTHQTHGIHGCTLPMLQAQLRVGHHTRAVFLHHGWHTAGGIHHTGRWFRGSTRDQERCGQDKPNKLASAQKKTSCNGSWVSGNAYRRLSLSA